MAINPLLHQWKARLREAGQRGRLALGGVRGEAGRKTGRRETGRGREGERKGGKREKGKRRRERRAGMSALNVKSLGKYTKATLGY